MVSFSNLCKQLFLNCIYFCYTLFYRKSLPSFKGMNIAIIYLARQYDGKAIVPFGEFIIREPFFRYLYSQGNTLTLISNKKDFMLLQPLGSYFKKIISLENLRVSKEKYDCIILAQNYLDISLAKIKEKTNYLISYAHQDLYKKPFLWHIINYFPRYYIGGRHELQRTFDILGIKWNINNFDNLPRINPSKIYNLKKRITIVLLEKNNFKSLPLSTIIKLINFIRNLVPDYEIVLVGDKKAISAASDLLKETGQKKIKNKVGKTSAQELASIFSSSIVVISPDTGTAHFAAALDRPLIVYYTKTVLDRWKPLGRQVYQIKENPYNILPLTKRVHAFLKQKI